MGFFSGIGRMAGQIFGVGNTPKPTPKPAPKPAAPVAPVAASVRAVASPQPQPAFGQKAVLNGKPVIYGGKDFSWQSPESFATIKSPNNSGLTPMGPGGSPSGSGLGQAKQISVDQRPAAVRDTISYAEGTTDSAGYPNYNMRYGDAKGSAGTLDTSAPHPVTPRPSPWGGSSGSNASGAYQHLDSTWKEMNDGTNVPMTPEAQDVATDRLIRERTDYDYNQPFEDQVHTLSGQWASFPNKQGVSNYGQPVHSVEELSDVYTDRLGIREEAERRRVYGMR